MEGNKQNNSEKIASLLTNPELFNHLQDEMLKESCGVKFTIEEVARVYKLLDDETIYLSPLFDVAAEATKEEAYKFILHHANYLVDVKNRENVIEDTKNYLLESYELTELINKGLAHIKPEVLDGWNDEQLESYENGNFDDLPDITAEYVNWDESELVYFRCNYADGTFELSNGGYCIGNTVCLVTEEEVISSVEYAISSAWKELDSEDIDYTISYLKSRNLHDKIQDEMSKADKLVASINPDAETTKKSNSTKLKL